MKKIFFISLIMVLTSLCFAQLPGQNLSDSVYNKIYELAKGEIKINDTIYFIDIGNIYVVATIFDDLDKKNKEICLTYNKLRYAIKLDPLVKINWEKKIFHFKSKQALSFIKFNDYEYRYFDICLKDVEAEELYNLAITEPDEFANTYNGICQKYIAHILFNKGYISSSSSLSGHIFVFNTTNVDTIFSKLIYDY